jgi:hypothetical protein
VAQYEQTDFTLLVDPQPSGLRWHKVKFEGVPHGFQELPASLDLGFKWRKVGDEKPSQGEELINERLAAALEKSTEFTRTEWEAFDITGLRTDHFVKSGASYFQPADELKERLSSVEEHDHAVDFEQKEWKVTCWDRTSLNMKHENMKT